MHTYIYICIYIYRERGIGMNMHTCIHTIRADMYGIIQCKDIVGTDMSAYILV